MLKEELKNGEIYYYDNQYIVQYPKGPQIICKSIYERSSNWLYNLMIEKATPHQRKWWNVCNKQDKFIPESELSKYNDDGTASIESLEEGCYYKVTNIDDFWMIGKVTCGNNGNNYNNCLRCNATFISSREAFYNNQPWCYKDDHSRDYQKLDENSEEALWLEECIKANKYIPKDQISMSAKNYHTIVNKENKKYLETWVPTSNLEIGAAVGRTFWIKSGTICKNYSHSGKTKGKDYDMGEYISFEEFAKRENIDISNYKTDENTIKIKDCIEGAYYYCKFRCSNEFLEIIFKYSSNAFKNVYIHLQNQVLSKGACCTANLYTTGEIKRFATQEEREWLDACIKENKFIDKEDIQSSGYLKLSDLKEGNYYVFTWKSSQTYVWKFNSTKALSLNGEYYPYFISPNGEYFTKGRFATQDEIDWLETCIKYNKFVEKEFKPEPVKSQVLIPQCVTICDCEVVFENDVSIIDLIAKEDFDCGNIVESCRGLSCEDCPFSDSGTVESRLEWASQYGVHTSHDLPGTKQINIPISVTKNSFGEMPYEFKVGDYVVWKNPTRSVYKITEIKSEKDWTIEYKGEPFKYHCPIGDTIRLATVLELINSLPGAYHTSGKHNMLDFVESFYTRASDVSKLTSSIQQIVSEKETLIEIPKMKEIKTNIEFIKN